MGHELKSDEYILYLVQNDYRDTYIVYIRGDTRLDEYVVSNRVGRPPLLEN